MPWTACCSDKHTQRQSMYHCWTAEIRQNITKLSMHVKVNSISLHTIVMQNTIDVLSYIWRPLCVKIEIWITRSVSCCLDIFQLKFTWVYFIYIFHVLVLELVSLNIFYLPKYRTKWIEVKLRLFNEAFSILT